MANTTRSKVDLDALEQSYWRVRIDQLKRELRADAPRPSIQVSDQLTTYGNRSNHKSSKQRAYKDPH